MKIQLCKAIAKNIGTLLSIDFWLAGLRDKDFPARTIATMIIFAACADILQMILVPGYPGTNTR
jgi:precorrin-3B methylase